MEDLKSSGEINCLQMIDLCSLFQVDTPKKIQGFSHLLKDVLEKDERVKK